MADGNLLEWNLFKNKPEILGDYTEVHVFNWGKSAFLIKNEKLYAYGEDNPCFKGLGLFVYNNPQELRFMDHFGVLQIATGQEHAVLLDHNYVVYCWGNNNHGQLGAGDTLSCWSYKKQNLSPIRQISCGEFSTLALSCANEVWFWGRQFNKDFIVTKIMAVPTRIIVPDHVDVESITSGSSVAAILDSEGTVYVWGISSYGQLGLGRREIYAEPKFVRLINNCKHIIIARNRTALITESGQFYIGSSDILSQSVLRKVCFPGTIVSIAATWFKDLFAIKNDKGEIWKMELDDPAPVTIKTQCKNIVEVFKDLWTPSIRPEFASRYNKPGIIRHMPLHHFNRNIDTVEEGRPAQDANQIKLTSNISKIDSSDSKTGGYMNVSELFNEEVCSDITIKLSDESIHAHKLVLYVKSKHFKSLIEKSSKDMTMVDMSNWTSRSYKTYIKYLYKGKLEIEAIEDIPEIFSLAEQDTNEKLKLECLQLWRMNLKPNNVVHLFHSAFNYQQQMLMQVCGPLLQEHLPKIVVSNEYIKLPEPVKLSLTLTAALLRSS